MENIDSQKELELVKKELEKVQKELNYLKEENKKLKNDYEQQYNIISKNLAYEIVQYALDSKSIKKTAEKYGCDVKYLYNSLQDWNDSKEIVSEAEDYHDYREKFDGRAYEIDELINTLNTGDIDDIEELNEKMRTPEKEELDKIITEYNDAKISLYDLSDKYDLSIINLFRLLKENNIIEKESDAIGYDDFYRVYSGEYEYNEYSSSKNVDLVKFYYLLFRDE